MAQLKILSHLLWQQSNCLTHRISRQGRQSMKPWTGPGGAPFSVGLSTGATQNNKCPETRWEDRQSYTYWYVDIVCIIYIYMYICIYLQYLHIIYITLYYKVISLGCSGKLEDLLSPMWLCPKNITPPATWAQCPSFDLPWFLRTWIDWSN